MNADALLLNYRIIAGGIHIQAGGQGYRSQRAVGRESHIVGLCHRRDFFHLRNAAGMGQVRLNNIHAARMQKAFEIPPGIQAFPCGNGDIARCRYLCKGFHIFTQNRLLQKHRVKFLQLFRQNLSHRLMHASVEIYGNPERPSAGLPDRRHPLQYGVNFVIGINHLQLFRCIHLNRGKAFLQLFPGRFAHIRRAVPANPGIHPHFIPAGAAHQLIYRRLKQLSLNIPQRLVNSGNGAHHDAAAPVKARPVQR